MRSSKPRQGLSALVDRLFENSQRFVHHWADLDHIEDFASGFGAAYARRFDEGSLALGSALCALTALILVQWV